MHAQQAQDTETASLGSRQDQDLYLSMSVLVRQQVVPDACEDLLDGRRLTLNVEAMPIGTPTVHTFFLHADMCSFPTYPPSTDADSRARLCTKRYPTGI